MEKRRMWTKKEIQFVRDNAGKIPVQQIADHLNRTRSAILSQVTRWGYPSRSSRPVNMTGGCVVSFIKRG